MRIGIIAAMEQEVCLLRDHLEGREQWLRAGCEIYLGRLQGVEVALLQSGIGKVAAALGTTLLLEHFQPDYVINTGSAGAMAEALSVGDIVLSDAVAYHDADVTAFGYQPGQMAGCPVSFAADPSLVELAEQSAQQLGLRAVCGLVCSGDSFINGARPLQKIRQRFPAAIAVEMEAAAIGHVCHQFAVPFVVIRAISDTADQNSHLSFEQFLSVAAKQSTLLVEALLQRLSKQP